jgi:hypothetical protein
MRGKHDPASGVGMDRTSWIIMLIWLVLCFSGGMGRIANTAHLAGSDHWRRLGPRERLFRPATVRVRGNRAEWP